MTRARCVLGDASLSQRFDAVRLSVITAARDQLSLRSEIVAMRERMAHAHSDKPGMFDIKQSAGGMIDAEFVMQFLVLSESGMHPELVANTGNIALLERAEVLGLLPPTIGHAAATAYRHLRQVQHTARLNEEPTQVDATSMVTERQAIGALWQAVFQSYTDAASDNHQPTAQPMVSPIAHPMAAPQAVAPIPL
jgi:glutamate-ammonia-ligase adenylyltransferase